VKLGARLMMACVLGACAMHGALGAILCADSAASIVSMLAAAASNGESNYVRIVGGTYSLTSEPTYAGTDTTGVDISGGWNGACTGQDAGATVLDGQGNMRTLVVTQNSFFPSATINVHDLTFNNGHAVYAVVGGGGLYAFDATPPSSSRATGSWRILPSSLEADWRYPVPARSLCATTCSYSTVPRLAVVPASSRRPTPTSMSTTTRLQATARRTNSAVADWM